MRVWSPWPPTSISQRRECRLDRQLGFAGKESGCFQRRLDFAEASVASIARGWRERREDDLRDMNFESIKPPTTNVSCRLVGLCVSPRPDATRAPQMQCGRLCGQEAMRSARLNCAVAQIRIWKKKNYTGFVCHVDDWMVREVDSITSSKFCEWYCKFCIDETGQYLKMTIEILGLWI